MNIFQYLASNLPELAPSAIVGGILTHLWSRFRNRLITLRWDVRYELIAFSSNDQSLGNTEVTHNGKPVPNVVTCNLTINNDSNRDLNEIVIDVNFLDGTTILGERGSVNDQIATTVYKTDIFMERAKKVFELPEVERPNHPDFNAVVTSRQYRLPVLNRYSKCSLILTVTRPLLGQQKEVVVGCNSAGIRVARESKQIIQFSELLGVSFKKAALAGLIVSSVCTVIAGILLEAHWETALVPYVLGLTSTLLGALALRLWRATLALLG